MVGRRGRLRRSAGSTGRDRALKRAVDVLASSVGLVAASPVLLPVIFLVWRQDHNSPFYIAPRVGEGGTEFRMVKMRSMVIDAALSGVDSTSASDMRITPVGFFIRRYKLDELTQLWNVLKGEMSLVGPRPNVRRETDLYTPVERELLSARPGITDFASIVFSDEGEILDGHTDPDIAYHQLIRPGKNRLGLFYVHHASFALDIRLVALTLVAIGSRSMAIRGVVKLLEGLDADPELVAIASRSEPLVPSPPPGSEFIVTARDGSLDGAEPILTAS